MNKKSNTQVAIIGGGFTGLSAAYELVKKGIDVTVLEADAEIGGLAAAFDVAGEKLDRFYHHWFTNDMEVMRLIEELGMKDWVKISPTNTGVYYANNFFKLSTPWDLLNFTPLSFLDRMRLGVLALRARRVKDWKKLEEKSAHEWLRELGGDNVYRVVWEPLLKGKFGPYAEDISAVWFWNKLKLRGGSRGKSGEERLAYFKGGFVALAEALADKIRSLGGRIEVSTPVKRITPVDGCWTLESDNSVLVSERIVVTTALPLVADMIGSWAPEQNVAALRRIRYLGNVCLVLELDRSLSETYWLNVNDSSFPFVGIIEHTNLEHPTTYGGRHIVYLSKYLPHTDRLYSMCAEEFLDFSFPFLKRMFPAFDKNWVKAYHLWRARWSQPIVEKNYSNLIIPDEYLAKGFHLCSMAQIYPEDRGTNYAIREGQAIGKKVANLINRGEQ